ncbi:hypothetical protein [Streptomyces thioluteus]|uniref:hypothetical protein n=1 Tax=Streptomyces thioluteus TaxID=66431 RepID=UPI0031E745EA
MRRARLTVRRGRSGRGRTAPCSNSSPPARPVIRDAGLCEGLRAGGETGGGRPGGRTAADCGANCTTVSAPSSRRSGYNVETAGSLLPPEARVPRQMLDAARVGAEHGLPRGTPASPTALRPPDRRRNTALPEARARLAARFSGAHVSADVPDTVPSCPRPARRRCTASRRRR